METSPGLGISGTRARAALLATTTGGSGTGSADRRVVFLASQHNVSNVGGATSTHETRTWPHNWTPNTGSDDYVKSSDTSPLADSKARLSRGHSTWSNEERTSSNSLPRQNEVRQISEVITRSNGNHTMAACNGFRIGVYGWRKRCLYFLILGLMIIVLLNLAITIWLLKVMEFSFEGIGSLKVVPGGIQLRGQATILDALIASSIKSRRGSNLMLESWANFTASARDDNGRVLAKLTLSQDRLECMSKSFHITDPRGRILFSADNDQVVVGSSDVKISGEGGAVFRGSVQTPLVRSKSGHDLRLESSTRSLNIRSPKKISIESVAGNITASCLSHLKIESSEVTFVSKNIYLKGLSTSKYHQDHGGSPSLKSRSSRQHQQTGRGGGGAGAGEQQQLVYQLCACSNGKLFLAEPEAICQADKHVC